MQYCRNKERLLPYLLGLFFFVFSVAIIIAGYVYYKNIEKHYRRQMEHQLSAIGSHTSEALVSWRRERIGDADVLYKNTMFSTLVQQYFNEPDNTKMQECLLEWLGNILTAHNYDSIILLDNQYCAKIIVPPRPELPDSFVSERSSEILRSNRVAFEDFYYNEQNRKRYLKILIPINNKDSQLIGVLALRIDPQEHLLSHLYSESIITRTGETLIVRRNGDTVQFLHDLRFRKEAAFTLQIPLANTQVPAVKAVLGQTGIVEGIDYRGGCVIADVRPVPDSPWFLVTRIDKSEVYRPILLRLWTIVATLGILLTITGTALLLFWKRWQFYRKLHSSAKRWSSTFDSITDLVSVIGPDFRIKKVNKAFANVLGKSQEDLVGQHCYEYMHGTMEPIIECPCRKTLSSKTSAKQEIFHTDLNKYLEVSTSPVIDNEGEILEIVHIIRDITERKKSEQNLKENEERLNTLFEANPTGVILIEQENRKITRINSVAAKMMGLPREKIIGQVCHGFLCPAQQNKCPICDFGQEVNHSEKVLITATGTKIPILKTVGRISLGGKKYLLESFVDITDIKLAQQALQESENKFKTLYESSRDAIMTLAPPEWKFTSGNPATIKMFDAETEEDFLSHGPWEVSPEYQPDGQLSSEKAKKQIEKAMLDGTNSFEWTHKRLNGEEFIATVLLSRIVLKGKDLLQATVRDISGQKRTQDELHQSYLMQKVLNELLLTSVSDISQKEMFEQFLDSICSAPLLGFEQKGVIFLVEDDSEMLVMQAQRGLSEALSTVCSKVPFGRCICGRTAAAGHTIIVNCIDDKHENKCDNMLPHGHYCIPITSSTGKVIGIFNIYTTENYVLGKKEENFLLAASNVLANAIQRKLTEMNLQKANTDLQEAIINARDMASRAEKANTAKSEFLAHMSHEIRTPLNSIIGFSEIFQQEQLGTEQKDYIAAIKNSGKHLLHLVQDILNLSKIEAGKMEIDIKPCSLEKLVSILESMMSPFIAEKGLEFKINDIGCLPANIATDSDRLEQCLINLVNNAVKFTEHGHIYVNISLEDKDGKPFIRFDVEDTGVGISAEFQDKIFTSFTQEDSRNSRKYGGAGLGLTISKKIAQLLGGDLTLTSEQGKGSVFSLSIPANVDLTTQMPFKRQDVHSYAETDENIRVNFKTSGRILIVDDIQVNNLLMKTLLNRMNLQVTIAEDGNEAIQVALKDSFDMIFMDVQMPRMDGYEATKILRSKGIKTPIIALTAGVMEGDDVKCLEVGCDAYLTKPVAYLKLIEILRKYLNNTNGNENPGSVNVSNYGQDRSNDANCIENEDDVVINWAKIAAGGLDEQVLIEIMPSYLHDQKEHLQALISSVKTGNAKDVALHVHAIKGAGRNLGVTRMTDIAASLESQAQQGDLSQAEELVKEIMFEFSRFEKFVSQSNWIEKAKRLYDKQTGVLCNS
jgi:PAS domain S-box-containing protein